MKGNQGNDNGEHEEKKQRGVTVTLDDRIIRKAVGTGKDVVTSVGGSLRETLNTVRTTKDFVVMVRLSKESLQKLDDLANCGLTKSRSESAAFLIAQGIMARADLYDKIAEQAEIIRKARASMTRLLDEEPDTTVR